MFVAKPLFLADLWNLKQRLDDKNGHRLLSKIWEAVAPLIKLVMVIFMNWLALTSVWGASILKIYKSVVVCAGKLLPKGIFV